MFFYILKNFHLTEKKTNKYIREKYKILSGIQGNFNSKFCGNLTLDNKNFPVLDQLEYQKSKLTLKFIFSLNVF